MDSARIEDWDLLPGTLVEVRLRDATVRAGRVDAVSLEAEVLWLANDGVYPRQLFEKAEGYEVWLCGADEDSSGLPERALQV